MSSLKITETFRLDAPPERVWRYLVDPGRVASCLPGASLDEVVDERTFEGSVRVSVGPVTVTYRGRMVFEEKDDGARRVRMEGKGREETGSGSATMSMVGTVVAAPGGGSEVTVESDVKVSGKIVRFGRGMIERVSQEIFKDFTACMAETLEAEGGDATAGGEPAAPAPSEPGAGEKAGRPEPEAARGLSLLRRAFGSWMRDLFGRESS